MTFLSKLTNVFSALLIGLVFPSARLYAQTRQQASEKILKQEQIRKEVADSLQILLPSDFMNRALNVFIVARAAGIFFPPLEGHTLEETAVEMEKNHNLSGILQANNFTPSAFLQELTCFVSTFAALQTSIPSIHPLAGNINLIRSKMPLARGLIIAMQKAGAHSS